MAKYSGANLPKSIYFLGYISGIVFAQQYWDAPIVVAAVIAIPCTMFTMIPFYLIDWLILDRFRKEVDRRYS
jgi:phage shock protein PspC (stress-responsive transcriptional regulator)